VVVERDDGGHRFIILPDQAYDYVETAAALQRWPTRSRR
jgi:fructokinase